MGKALSGAARKCGIPSVAGRKFSLRREYVAAVRLPSMADLAEESL